MSKDLLHLPQAALKSICSFSLQLRELSFICINSLLETYYLQVSKAANARVEVSIAKLQNTLISELTIRKGVS